jgi:hypothetical protein
MMKLLLATTAIVALSVPVGATTISGTLTADDGVAAYIGTVPGTLGTQAVNGLGTYWGTIKSFSTVALTPGVTNYLQIIAQDGGPPGMFIGSFSLSDTGFHFANATQSLVTGGTGWAGNLQPSSSWALPSGAVTTIGPNGIGPWGNLVTGASFVWPADAFSAGQACGNCYVSFIAAINPAAVTPQIGVPEPLSAALFGTGLLGLGLLRRRA